MSRIKQKFIRFGTGSDDVNAQVIPADYTPTNYTPVAVGSEGTDKISSHLKGINNALTGAASPGDLSEGSFSGLANNTANQVITGFAFANGVVRSFDATMSLFIDATSDLYAQYKVNGIQRGSDWAITTSLVGDAVLGLDINITTAGQLRISIGNITGFSSGLIKFRAITTSV